MKKKLFLLGWILLCLFIPQGVSFCSKQAAINKKGKAFNHLEKRLREETNQLHGIFSLLIKDLNSSDFEIAFKEDEKFPAASLIKLPLAAAAFRAVSDGRFSLSQEITIKKKDLTGGSGLIKSMAVPVTLKFEEILELMIAFSDNTATNKVISLLGFDYIKESFEELGLEKTTLVRKMMDFSSRGRGVENYTTASEICFLLEKIYKGEFIDEESSRLMLSFLKKQKVNDRLPRYFTKGLNVAHKTGLEKGIVHDAGIFFSPKGDYIICVLTKKVESYQKAKKFIAKLALLTYNFYR